MNWKEELLNAKEENIYVKFDSMNQLQENKEKIIKTVMQKIYNEKITDNKKVKIKIIGINIRDFANIFDRIKDIYFPNSETLILKPLNYKEKPNQYRIIFDKEDSFLIVEFPSEDVFTTSDIEVLIPSENKIIGQIITFSQCENCSSEISHIIKFKEEKLPLTKRIEHYIEKLFSELEEIPMKDKTTMTRERIIGMIKNLEDLRKRLIMNY